MAFKKSRFNFIYEQSPGTYVIYNTYSKALLVLEEDELNQYNTLHFTDLSIEETLLSNGLLINENFDEKAFIRYCHNATKYSRDALHLVLAITMDCNFGCPYCYENRRKGKMGVDIQNAILAFIRRHLEEGIKVLDVTWYGGEPLLYPDIVSNLGSQIRDLIYGRNCQLNMYMVTNGYLLTPEIVEMIDHLGISKVQITLDGLSEHHDARRHLRAGGGTFEHIYKNLRLFEEYSIRVDIRMNVDNENYTDYLGLQDLLSKLDNPNIVLYPSPVEDINQDTVNEVSDFMSFEEFEQFTCGIGSKAKTNSFETKVLDDRYCYCQAETENNYVIDELGNCYKCWDQVGRKEVSCFNILNQNNKDYVNIIKFMGWDPFEDEKCKDCIFLPICFGGCKFHRLNTGRYDCGFTEESMKRYLEGTYFTDNKK